MATGKALSSVADVAEPDADATYGQEEADLINEIKAQLNALFTELRDRGWMDR